MGDSRPWLWFRAPFLWKYFPPNHSGHWVVVIYCSLQTRRLRPRWEDKALRFKAEKEQRLRAGDLG